MSDVHHLGVQVEPVATVGQPLHQRSVSARSGCGRAAGTLQFFQKNAFIGLARVEFEGERRQACVPKTAMDDVQRGHLLSDEKYRAALSGRRCYDVRDSLRLASPRRALDDQVAPPRDLLDGDGLGRIGIDNMVHRDRLNNGIDLVVVRDDGFRGFESVLQQAADQRVVVQPTVCRPVFGIQIAVHQELGEGEETEHHGIGLYFPSRLARNSLRDAGDVCRDIHVIFVAKILDFYTEFAVHLRLERKVRRRRLRPRREMESIGSAAPLEANGE
jgi:hypothetical protein